VSSRGRNAFPKDQEFVATGPSDEDVWLAFEGLLGIPCTEGNRIDVLRNGCRIFPAMLDAIENATRSIEFLTFVYWTGDIADRFAEALAARARSGVTVKVLLDAFGAAEMSRELVTRMREAGCEVRWFRPVTNWKIWSSDNRTHRKVLVCDGRVGFTGGVGIAEEWQGDARDKSEWRDTHFRIRGPAVHGLQAAFYGNWLESGGLMVDALPTVAPLEPAGEARIQVIRATAAVGWSDIAMLLRTIVARAERSIRFVTPYLAPDEASARLLAEATERGVEIEIMIPGPHSDQRISRLAGADQLDVLLEAGIKILRYQPTMLHAKVIIMDGTLACIGSANFNHRSMLKDDEIVLVTDCPETIAMLDRHFEEDARCCERLDIEAWRNRGFLRRSREILSRLLKQEV
jgi:cardiolipin synthase